MSASDSGDDGSANGDRGFANPEWVEQAESKLKQQRRAEMIAEAEAGGTKAWIETKLDEHAKEVDIFDRTYAFRPVGAGFVADTVEKAQGLDDGEDLGDAPGMFRDICAKLGDHCIERADEPGPPLDESDFLALPVHVVRDAFEDVGAELDDEERGRAERFRQE